MNKRVLPRPARALCAAQLLAVLSYLPLASSAAPAVVLNEIHYHPVELSALDINGAPVLDLSEDVHEFVEIHNPGSTNVSLAGWRLSGDVEFAFPTNAVLVAGRYLVIARDPGRLLSIPQYSLAASNVFGPYLGKLGNRNGTVRLRDAFDSTVDAVSYSAEFPWAIGADALGADDEWTGLNSANFQYRGRSLERVSAEWAPNDPANWLASPAPGNPSPGRANAVTRVVPKPVVTAIAAYQASTGSPIIRANQSVRIDCAFSEGTSLSSVQVEYFLDDINVTNELRSTAAMTATGVPGDGTYTVLLPARADRSVVRYRVRANRGTGLEAVSPRPDDPFAWHAYFVTPVRASTNRIYDCFISAASLNTLATNLNPANPGPVDVSVFRRITQPNPPGVPSQSWNATEPAIFVADGVVYDARARYHGSQYRRSPSNNSWKWQFPRYQKFDNRGGIFISDNDDVTVACGILYRMAGVPQSYTRWVDFYLNNASLIRRMDQDEMDDSLVERFFAEQRLASPELPREGSGEFYKSQGNFLFTDPTGPFGYGGYRLLPALPPYWTELQRYEHTYGLQMNGWKGHRPFLEMLHGLWAARGDTHTAPSPNIPNLRAWLAANFDVDTTLTSMAIRAWTGGWDNFNHNHFIWRRENGKWVVLQWDFDGELDIGTTNATIYLSEHGQPLIFTAFGGPPAWVDANWVNDSFYKAYREEYKRRLWTLNNTLLNPTNITAIGLGSYRAYADGRFASVNRQVALGTFHRPRTPVNVAPGRLQSAFPPAALVSSPYAHSASPAPAHYSTTWWIRGTNGTYDTPLFKTTTTATSNLTSLPIPFEKLTFGQTYAWKCVHTDTDGHPSAESAETPFIYGAEPSFAPLIAIDDGALWRFNTNGATLPSNWRTIEFDDGTWPEGAPLIGDDSGPLPEPIRTPILRANRLVTYFRKSFVFDGDVAGAYLRLRHVVDDGIVVWLNGVEVHRVGVSGAPGTLVGNTTVANRAVTNAVYEGPFFVVPTNLVVGLNVIAATVHRHSTVSPDMVYGLAVDVAAPPMPGAIVINEILADNRAAVTHGGGQPDYVELYNNTDLERNLDGLSLSDNVRRPGKFVFPAGTRIPAHGHLVVWCDSETNAPGLHTGFALDNDGQTVALFTIQANSYVLADSITFGLQIPDYAVGRSVDGTGAWVLATPTPGSPHSGAGTGAPGPLKINEWMATDAGGPDWIELFNPGSLPVELSGLSLSDNPGNPAKSVIPPLSFIAAAGHRQFIADEDPGASARHLAFRLSSGGETIGLYDAARVAIDTVVFGPQITGVSEGRLPDGAEGIVPFPTTASPDEPNHLPVENLVINEVLAHSDPPFEDAVEILNVTDTPADIGGWWLSDDRGRPQKFHLPPGTTVPAHGYLVLYEFQFNPSPPVPSGFAFSSARGDEVYLSEANPEGSLTGYRTGARFAASESGVSIGRFATSQGVEFVRLSAPTFGADNPGTVEQFRTGTGADNPYAAVGPVVLSEVMYHPPDLAADDNGRDEFVELRNITPDAVPLFDPSAPTNTWRLRDAVDFTFPTGVTLAPGESVLIVGFDPVAGTNELAAFLETYGPTSARFFGPWTGKLDNSSDSVELVRPDSPVAEPGPDFGYVPAILVDRANYTDSFPWPEGADGTGYSLMRSPASAYGNDPLNWFAWFPTPGRENVLNTPPVITLVTPADGLVVTGPTSILLSANVNDPDGSIARVDFYDGTNLLARLSGAPFEFNWTTAAFGPHVVTVVARDNGYATSVSAPARIRVASQPPVVTLTTPPNGGLFIASNTVFLAASATDTDTPISAVEFHLDGVKLAEDLTPPYAGTWIATPGYHVLTAVATDNSGTTGSSPPARIFVQSVARSESVAVAGGSTWRYYDGGGNPGSTWTNVAFADGAWDSGIAELGFGDGDEATLIRRTIGTTPSIAFYFRNKFVLNSVSDIAGGQLNLLRDDGAVAYLNGVEIARQNMPPGPVTFQTAATVAIAGVDEITYFPASVSAGSVVAGTNILAIEVHQNSTASSDVSFDAELKLTRTAYGPAITAPPESQTVGPGANVTFSVTAIGTGPLRYQWRYNGMPLSRQTNASLFLQDVQLADSGDFTVTVTNDVAGVTSPPATLTVTETGIDSDGDGIPDEWELAQGLDPFNPSDRDLDGDGDRMTSWDEYVAGTNPNDALSVLKIDSISRGPAAILTFAAAANIPYSVQYTDRIGASPWRTLLDLPARATNRTALAVAPSASPPGSRFFRVAAPEAPPGEFRILSIASSRAATLTFSAVSNRTYTVEYADGPGLWRWLDDVPARPTNHTAVVSDPSSANSRYYRVLIPGGN